MRTSLNAERRRLARIFGALLVTAAPTAAIEACGTDDSASPRGGADARSDTTVNGDGMLASGDAAEAAADGTVIVPGYDASCGAQIDIIDSGLDGDAYADPGCRYTLACGVQGQLFTVGCQVYVTDITNPDVTAPLGCYVSPESGCEDDAYAPDAPVTFICPECITSSGGRRPAGLARGRRREGIGGWLGALAHAEAASVLAFERLTRELSHHDAPRAIVNAAARAARDEVRHARIIGAASRARGVKPKSPRLGARSIRRLSTIARENAVEGCVRETFSALLAQHQAAHAADPALRRAFARIAEDELRHAALSWTVASWIEPRLSARSRKRVHDARIRAARDLERAIAARQDASFDRALGLPTAPQATALVHGLMSALVASL